MSTSIAVLALLGMALQAIFITVEHKEKYVPAVILKGSSAIVFCVIGIVAMATAAVNQSFAKLVVFGLCFGALGDIC